jgi:hypothetical protein
MNLDVVEELRDHIELQYNPKYAIVLEHALAEILRLNDIIERNEAMHDEMYGRRSNARNQEIFK